MMFEYVSKRNYFDEEKNTRCFIFFTELGQNSCVKNDAKVQYGSANLTIPTLKYGKNYCFKHVQVLKRN